MLLEVLQEAGKNVVASVKMVAEATVVLLGHVEGKLVPARGRSLRCSRTGIFVTRHTLMNVYIDLLAVARQQSRSQI